MKLVVDASVAAKWFIEEEGSEAALLLFEKGRELHAPELFLLEMDNIVCKWIRRKVVTADEGAEVRAALRKLPLRIHGQSHLLDPAFTIAIGTGLSIYDCLYLALAIQLKGRMVTADRRLHRGLARGPFSKHALWIAELE